MNMVARGVALAALAGLVSCAETVHVANDASPSDAVDAGDDAMDPMAFVARQQELYCMRALDCPSSREASGGVYADVATCLAVYRRFAEPYDRRRLESVEAGRVHFEAATARRCLADMTRHCPTSGFGSESCLNVFSGVVAAGASCETGECAPGFYCDLGDPRAPVCPGRCLATSTAPGTHTDTGASCRADPGGYPFLVGGNCFSARYEPPVESGQPCGEIYEPAGRVRVVPCADGLACSSSLRAGGSRCMLPLARDATCSPGDVCVIGYTCDATVRATGHCTASGISRAPGGPCTPHGESGGTPPTCDPYQRLECGDDGRCVRVGDGSEGSRCVLGNSPGLCDEGLFCDPSTDSRAPICNRQHPVGAPCGFAWMCQSGICREGVCTARLCE